MARTQAVILLFPSAWFAWTRPLVLSADSDYQSKEGALPSQDAYLWQMKQYLILKILVKYAQDVTSLFFNFSKKHVAVMIEASR